jgi:hypothetical protein
MKPHRRRSRPARQRPPALSVDARLRRLVDAIAEPDDRAARRDQVPALACRLLEHADDAHDRARDLHQLVDTGLSAERAYYELRDLRDAQRRLARSAARLSDAIAEPSDRRTGGALARARLPAIDQALRSGRAAAEQRPAENTHAIGPLGLAASIEALLAGADEQAAETLQSYLIAALASLVTVDAQFEEAQAAWRPTTGRRR